MELALSLSVGVARDRSPFFVLLNAFRHIPLMRLPPPVVPPALAEAPRSEPSLSMSLPGATAPWDDLPASNSICEDESEFDLRASFGGVSCFPLHFIATFVLFRRQQ